jgi:thiol-disulfide isomerase/thioredoxin
MRFLFRIIYSGAFGALVSLSLFQPAFAHQPGVQVIGYPQLLELIADDSGDSVRVINFWATWCRPCVAEMPYFEGLSSRIPNARVIFVSFDRVEDLEKRVLPFLESRKIQSEVLLLDETDFNAFIDLVDASWSGAIPATLFLGGPANKRYFHEGELTESQIDETVRSMFNSP